MQLLCNFFFGKVELSNCGLNLLSYIKLLYSKILPLRMWISSQGPSVLQLSSTLSFGSVYGELDFLLKDIWGFSPSSTLSASSKIYHGNDKVIALVVCELEPA